MMLSRCAICGGKKSKFIKGHEAKGLLSNLGIRTPLSKIPLLGDILFKCNSVESNFIKITLSYFLKCGEDTKTINPLVLKAINGGTIILSKCVVRNTKKSRFIKKEKAFSYKFQY